MDNDPNLEQFFIRFDELASHRSSFQPVDTRLDRFERERFSVIGRPNEGSTEGKYRDEGTTFSVVYLKCMPGKGIGMHAHDSPEVFIPMSGTWRISMEGERHTTAHPWDVLTVPPNVMHGAENLSDEPAYMMAINPGTTGVPIRLDPALVQELRDNGEDVSGFELPGDSGTMPAAKEST